MNPKIFQWKLNSSFISAASYLNVSCKIGFLLQMNGISEIIVFFLLFGDVIILCQFISNIHYLSSPTYLHFNWANISLSPAIFSVSNQYLRVIEKLPLFSWIFRESEWVREREKERGPLFCWTWENISTHFV